MAYIGISQIPGITLIRESGEAGTRAGVKKAWATRKGEDYKNERDRDEKDRRGYELQDEPVPIGG